MPRRNRVDPFARIHAVPDRGLFMGNRGGCFHRADGTLKPREWASDRWITCRLDFKGRRRQLMRPGAYTELFFLDEATALAAGHRPCFECRRDDANGFIDALMERGVFETRPKAGDLDRLMAGDIQKRLRGERAPETCQPGDLPDAAIFASDGEALLKCGSYALPWSFAGYGPPRPLPAAPAHCMTPRLALEALRGGYIATLHPSATSEET